MQEGTYMTIATDRVCVELLEESDVGKWKAPIHGRG